MQYHIEGEGYNFQVPNMCPFCHVKNIPKALWYEEDASYESAQEGILSVWQCANEECHNLYVTEHVFNYDEVYFKRYLNGTHPGPIWPKPIENLKDASTGEQTKFIETYLQSLKAEMAGLSEICGMGYRKSIEYLVKDWAIQNNPDKQGEIEQLWLGQVISNYYSGELKDILERATWLGNDQSHYNKLFEDFDLGDLKELIALIMVELDTQFKRRHYIENIQKRK